MRLSQRIAINTLTLSGSHMVCRMISFILVLAIARHYSTDNFGQYTFALSLVELFMVLSDLGIGTFMMRDIARNPQDSGALFGGLGILKLFYSLITFGLILVFLKVLHYSHDIVSLTIVFAVRSTFDSFFGLCTSLFKGHQRMTFIPPLDIGGIILSVSLGLLCMNSGMGLLMIANGFMLVSAIKLCITVAIVFKKFDKPVFNSSVKTIWALSKQAFPFGLGTVFVRIITRIDSVMLSKMATMVIVGYYNAAYNLIIVLLFLPGSFREAVFPVMSRFSETSDYDLHRTFERFLKYSMIIGIPMSVGIFALSDRFILFFYGVRYTLSITVLEILCWLLASSFGTYAFTTMLNATNKEKKVTLIIFYCSLLNVFLNLLLIPKWQHLGASAATLVTELCLFTLSYLAVKKYVLNPGIFKYLLRPALASFVMYFIVHMTKTWLLVFPILFGAISYTAMLFLLHTFDKTDLGLLTNLMSGKGDRLGDGSGHSR